MFHNSSICMFTKSKQRHIYSKEVVFPKFELVDVLDTMQRY